MKTTKPALIAAAALMAMFTPAPAFAGMNPKVDWCQRGFNPTAYSGYMWIPCWAQAIDIWPY
jgi:hypothetical protein